MKAKNKILINTIIVSILIILKLQWFMCVCATCVMQAPVKATMTATTLTVSWNCRNLEMLSYTFLPHMTAFTMLEKLSSVRMMSEASLATSVPAIPWRRQERERARDLGTVIHASKSDSLEKSGFYSPEIFLCYYTPLLSEHDISRASNKSIFISYHYSSLIYLLDGRTNIWID